MTERKWKMKKAFEKFMEEMVECVDIIDGQRFLIVLEKFISVVKDEKGIVSEANFRMVGHRYR